VIREANFSAKHTSSQEDPRVPHPDADSSGPRGDLASPAQGPGAPLGVARARPQRRESRDRLTAPREFRRVLREGRGRGAGGLVVHVWEREARAPSGGLLGAPAFPQEQGLSEARLGLVVPGAVGTAVERNRLKRQIRAAWRELRANVTPVDCVVVVRKGAVGIAFAELAGRLESCLRSLSALSPPISTSASTSAGVTNGAV
jgi:ribonuclease P protein component